MWTISSHVAPTRCIVRSTAGLSARSAGNRFIIRKVAQARTGGQLKAMELGDGASTESASNGTHKQQSISSDTDKLPYEKCATRILDLRPLGLSPDRSTLDDEFRQIYKDYIRPQQGSAEHQKSSRQLQAVITSLTTGIAPPVAFPTETVYGLGADATKSASIAGIFAAKGRPSDNPLIVHVSSIAHLERCLGGTAEKSAIPVVYRDLLAEFWPGPLTVLIPVPAEGKGIKFAPNVHPGQSTIGFRVPSSPSARFLIAVTDRPIAAPSANSSGKPSPTTAKHVFDDLNEKINFILDGGNCEVGVESTVVDGLSDPPLILRPGGLSKGDLKRWGKKNNNVWQHIENGWEQTKSVKRKRDDIESTNITSIKVTKTANKSVAADVFESPVVQSPAAASSDLGTIDDDTSAPRAPGMKYKHYAPSGRMFLFEADEHTGQNDVNRVYRKIRELLGSRDAIIYDRTGSLDQQAVETDVVVRRPTLTFKIAILTSTTWAVEAGLHHEAIKHIHPDWDNDDQGSADMHFVDDMNSTRSVGMQKDADGVPKKQLSIETIDLGRDAATVAKNLFAALRTCDDLGCEWIFAEAPERLRMIDIARDEALSESDKQMPSTGGVVVEEEEDEFETVLERMRKAATEILQA